MMKKTILAIVVFAALTSTSAIAARVDFDATDSYGKPGTLHISGTGGVTYLLDEIKDAAQEGKDTAKQTSTDLKSLATQTDTNRVGIGLNGTKIHHLEQEAVVVNAQAQQLRTDLDTNTKALSVLGGNVQQLQRQAADFVSKTEFNTDQDRQDAALTDVQQDVADNAQGVAGNKAALANKVDTSVYTQGQKDQDAAAQAETQRVNGELAKKATSTDLTAETNRATQAELKLENTKADKAQVLNTVQGSALAQGEAALAQGVLQNHDEQVKTNQRVADNSKQLANHEKRITDLEARNQQNFNKIHSQQNRDRKEFRAGISGAIALASIPQAPQGHAVGFGMGVGTFNSETAVSAGVSARLASNVSVKTGLSWDSQGNVGAGAGFLVSY